MDPEHPKDKPIEFDLPKPEKPGQEEIPAEVETELNVEEVVEEETRVTERIEEIRSGLHSEEETALARRGSISSSVVEGSMRLSINDEAVSSFLVEQGLTTEQAQNLKIKFTRLPQSSRMTRGIIARLPFLPERIKEIFTRIQSLKGDTLEIYTNNLEAIYGDDDAELIARDTLHHLAHFAQRKKGVGRLKHFLTRLPIIHGLSRHEREARDIARGADLGSGELPSIVHFSNQNKQGDNRLKIKL